jgi:MFS family permease
LAAFSLQFVSGIFWAFFEMGFSVIFFKHLEKREKIAILSLYNFFNALAVAVGGLFGAWLIQFGGETSYYRAFFGGAVLRILLVLIVPIRFQPERRTVPHCIV